MAATADAQPADAQPACAPSAAAAEALVAAGFESVGVCRDGATATVTYENRLYRYDVRALEAVAHMVSATLPGVERLRLLPTRAGVPLVSVETTAPGADGSLDDAATTASLDTPDPPLDTQRPPWGTLDAVLHPVVRAAFGDFDTPIRADIEIHPTLEATLWPGAGVTAQLIVPLVSDVQGSDASVRPGILAAHQRLRLPGATFARLSVGRFAGDRNDDRYGADLGLDTYIADGRVRLHGRAGITGFAGWNSSQSRIDYSALNRVTYRVGAEAVVLPRYALTVGASLERFLSEQTGFRAEVARHFGETRIAFFGLLTEGEPNVGGRIAFALPVARHARPGRVRARLADRMAVEYRYRRLTNGTPGYDVVPFPTDALGPLRPALLDAHLRHLNAR